MTKGPAGQQIRDQHKCGAEHESFGAKLELEKSVGERNDLSALRSLFLFLLLNYVKYFKFLLI